MNRRIFASALFPILLLSGCRQKPAHIVRFAGPTPEIFYTFETWEGQGPLAADFTRVFAHFAKNAAEDHTVVLDGAYLTIPDIRWNGQHDVIICLTKGRTNTFRNDVVLNAGGESLEIRNHLDEGCPTH